LSTAYHKIQYTTISLVLVERKRRIYFDLILTRHASLSLDVSRILSQVRFSTQRVRMITSFQPFRSSSQLSELPNGRPFLRCSRTTRSNSKANTREPTFNTFNFKRTPNCHRRFDWLVLFSDSFRNPAHTSGTLPSLGKDALITTSSFTTVNVSISSDVAVIIGSCQLPSRGAHSFKIIRVLRGVTRRLHWVSPEFESLLVPQSRAGRPS
jgi:hypothetical protein